MSSSPTAQVAEDPTDAAPAPFETEPYSYADVRAIAAALDLAEPVATGVLWERRAAARRRGAD